MAALATLETTSPWFNNDGLNIKFGPYEVGPHRAGEFRKDGEYRTIEAVVNLARLTSTANRIVDDTVVIPKNARVDRVEVLNVTATTVNGSPTLHLGLVKSSDRETMIDADGLLVSAPVADWNALGERKVYEIGVTGAGALIGTTVGTDPGLLTVANPNYNAGVTDFTAGVLRIRLYLRFATTAIS